MTRTTRPVSWVSAARRAFGDFPEGAQGLCLAALTIAAEGGKADTAKPIHGLGSGIFEVALAYRGNAFRVIYAVNSMMMSGSCMRSKRSRAKASRHRNVKSIWSGTGSIG